MEAFFNRLYANETRFPKQHRRALHNLFVTAFSFKDKVQVRLTTYAFNIYRNLVREGFKLEITRMSTDDVLEYKYLVTFKPSAILAKLSKYD